MSRKQRMQREEAANQGYRSTGKNKYRGTSDQKFNNGPSDQNGSFPQTRKKVEIKHLNRTQKELSKSILSCDITFATGAAGTGKTYLAALHAMQMKTEGLIDKIIVCRPVINAGGEELGFLPGNITEKMDPYLRPIFDVFGTHWNKKTIIDMINYGELEISPLAYMRGRTFTRAFIIADEMQNANAEQLIMLLTRLGEDSKMVITGDPMQKDIPNSGFDMAKRKLKNVAQIGFVNFTDADVVRHPTVKEILNVWNTDSVVVANDDVLEDVEAELGKLPGFITREAA